MANQYSALTAENIRRKLNRKRNPVTTMVGLANEFGVNTTYRRRTGRTGSAAPGSFRTKVKALIGEAGYKNISSR